MLESPKARMLRRLAKQVDEFRHELQVLPVLRFLFQKFEAVALQVLEAILLPAPERVVICGVAVSHENAEMTFARAEHVSRHELPAGAAEPEERDVVREEPVDVAAQSVARPSRLVRALDGRLAVAFERLGLLPKA